VGARLLLRVPARGGSDGAQAGKIKLDGDETALDTLAGLMDTFDPDFSIVTP
jgi:alkyl sulfatase BDS1-like metallo-beta-lactamase superfamily hydrolase